jgi:hypothetical protein
MWSIKVPITYCTPLDHGPVLPSALAANAKAISVSPSEESVFIVIHGDGCEHFWVHLMRRSAQAISDITGIPTSRISWGSVQTGRSPGSQDRFVEGVEKAIKAGGKRVLVVSAFNGVNGENPF